MGPLKQPLPEDCGMSVYAVEQRLIAILEELDREFARSPAILQRNGHSTDWTSSGARRTNTLQIGYEPKSHRAAEMRAAAFVAGFGGLVGLWLGLTAWIRPPTPLEASVVRTDPAGFRQGVTMAGDHRITGASAAGASSTSPTPVIAREQTDNAARTQEIASQAVDGADGLSVEEFNARVRRLLTEHRMKPYDSGLSEAWPSGVLIPNDTAPSPLDEPLPIAPPSAAMSALETATAADLSVESVAVTKPVGQDQIRHAPIIRKPKAKAAGGVAKFASHKPTNKRFEAQSRETSTPTGASGPLAYIQGAAAALTGVIKDWGQTPRPAP